MTTIISPELKAAMQLFASMPEAEKRALVSSLNLEKGIVTVNAASVDSMNDKAGFKGTNAGFTMYKNSREIQYLSLIVKHSDTESDKSFFKLEGGKKSESHDAAKVTIEDKLNKHISDLKANLTALEQAQAFIATL